MQRSSSSFGLLLWPQLLHAALGIPAPYAHTVLFSRRCQVHLIATFNSASFNDCLAIAKEGALTIGSVEEVGGAAQCQGLGVGQSLVFEL